MNEKSEKLSLFPVVLVAVSFLLLFKAGALLSGSKSSFAAIAPAAAQDKKKPEGTKKAAAPKTKNGDKKKPPAVVGIKRKENIALLPQSTTEVQILQRLAERRQELDKRSKILELRLNLIKAAEEKVDQKIQELKKLSADFQKAFTTREKKQAAKLKGLVSMYENMRPKDAARIFNRLEATILIEVAEQMNTRKMAPVLALMDSAAAERLTVALATRAKGRVTAPGKAALPKVRPDKAG